jgi:hypothetical protein
MAEIDAQYLSGTSSTPEPETSTEEVSQTRVEVSQELYGVAKPRRVIVRARITRES